MMQLTTDHMLRHTFSRDALAAIAVGLAACGCAATPDGSANDGGVPLDAGLKPGARVEDCRTSAGVRLCGTTIQCYEHGPDCNCVGDAPNPTYDQMRVSNAAVGVCGGIVHHLPDLLYCGDCRDGELCVWKGFGLLAPLCVAEDIARVAWTHGLGAFFSYADGSPYNGVPIPSADLCPLPDGDLELCGGDCGGCAKPGFHCTGRSPTHPLGVCTNSSARSCSEVAGGRILSLQSETGWRFAPAHVCVRDCSRLAATVPGGAVCIDPQ